MSIKTHLDDFASLYGADSLEGAIVLVDLDRGTDKLIRNAMGADPRHKGSPHLWSHTFLVAEPWRGLDTRILDMTIRAADGRIEWEDKADALLRDALLGIAGKAGRVYSGTVADYHHEKTLAVGVKWIEGLSAEQRRLIVRKGLAIQAEDYHYDFPGLLRELARFLIGASIESGDKLLFCSAYCQRAYRDALGLPGDFAETLVAADTTPDDLWYSVRGSNFPPLPPDAMRTRGGTGAPVPPVTRGGDGLLFPDLADTGGPLPIDTSMAPIARSAGPIATAVERALQAAGRGASDEQLRSMLLRLRDRIERGGEDPIGFHDSRKTDPDDVLLSLAWSIRLEGTATEGPRTVLDVLDVQARTKGGGAVVGTDKYELLDPGWAAALLNRLAKPPVDYPTVAPPCVQAGAKARVGLLGDWGTGSAASDLLASRLLARAPDYTIHLGDVYYSGTEKECARFVERWPGGASGSFAINSNHEMYSGGRGYFGVTLASDRFSKQRGAPNFSLVVGGWRLLGLDSAYHALGVLFDKGKLGPEEGGGAQREWLRAQIAEARAAKQRLILLSHHHGLEEDTTPTPFWDEVGELLGEVEGDAVWYWGHVHAGMVYHPQKVGAATVHGRCAGHGGVPWRPFDADEVARFAWGEDLLADDPSCPRRARNGFVVLDIDGDALVERYYDERGAERYTRSWA